MIEWGLFIFLIGSEFMICLRCGGKTHVEFNHNVEINSYDYCFIDEIPLKNRNIKMLNVIDVFVVVI